MKIIPILLLTLLITIVTNGQNVNLKYVHSSLKGAVKELQAEGIDTAFIYHYYCAGCETANSTANCNGFMDARILWKKQGKAYTSIIFCDHKKTKPILTTSKAFDFFLNNVNVLTERKPLPKGRFYPPVPVHHFGEDFYLVINKKWYYTNLRMPQRENKHWKQYSWIEPTIKLSDLNKAEVDKK
jgi:hypothetical protein